MLKKIKFTFVFALLSLPLLSQYYYTDFGQSRIQYKKFDWYFYSTTHFDIYYYEGGSVFALQAIDFLEEEFTRLTDLLGYAPYSKTTIIIYNSTQELQQSNIGIDGAVFTMGGQTDFVKLQMEIAHPGSATEFKKDLVYRLSRILIEDMLFGGSLAEIFQSSYLLSLPRWFIDGAARYLAYGWDSEMDDYMRDYLSKKRIKKLKKSEGLKAGLLGQSIWNYISLKYGRSNVSNILNLTRIIRNEEKSIGSTLGLSYKQFIVNWQKYYTDNNTEIAENYVMPDKEQSLIYSKNEEIKYNSVKSNSSGNLIAYSENRQGKYDVFVFNKETKRIKKVLSGGYKVKSQQVDYELPLLNWAGEDVLGVIYFKRGYLYLASINLKTGDRFDKPLTRFRQVKSFSLNENGRLAILSGDVDGKSDIFLLSMRRNAIRRITSDIYDDLDPTFIPGTAAIVFSSNRPADSLKITDTSIDNVNSNFNLFLYDLDTTQNSFFRLTNTYDVDSKPVAKNNIEIYFLSDQRGINNLFKYNLLDSTYIQITNFSKGIKDYDLHFNKDGIAFLMLDDGIDKIFLDDNVNLIKSNFTPQTQRQRIRQAQYLANIFDAKQLSEQYKKEEEEIAEAEIEVEDLLNDSIVDPENYKFDGDDGLEEGFIDTDNYSFEDQGRINKSGNKFRPESFFSNYQRLELANKVNGPVSYEPQFSFNNLITSFAIDPLRGFGVVLETQISDMLGNHKVTGGGYISRDLKSGDLFAEYRYLKYWMDFKLRIASSSFFFREEAEDFLMQRYTLNTIQLGAAVPLTNWFRIEVDPFIKQTDFKNQQFSYVVNRNPQNFAEDSQSWFVGSGFKVVFDNSIEHGFNILQGTRGSFEFKQYLSLADKSLNFSHVKFDVRHYQKIHRELTLATRIYYGQSLGPNRQNFLIGGVPNWLFARTNIHPTNDPLEIKNDLNNTSILFTEYVTNLRGFNYNELFGSSTFLFNSELKFPVFDYFSRGPVNSTFLRNFMLVGFFDLGSAWTGRPPLTRENSANQIQYTSSPFTANITNYRNPWLASYGFGLRTVLMGYYAKIDFARPIRDFEVKNGRITVSVGLDF